MSSDFYLKAQTLHEEFQKKELQYLKAERKLNDSLMWKRNLDVPLQEYLQEIHVREKKNEEIYQSIMKQMNELDQHTDLLCLKIEKLGLFRNIQAGYKLSDANYPLTLRYIPQDLNTVQNNTESIGSHSASGNYKSLSLKSASTQTDSSNIYCDNCKLLLQVPCQPNQMQNSSSSNINILSVNKDEPEKIDSSKSQNNSFSFLHKKGDDSPFLTSSLKSGHFSSCQPTQIQNSTSSTIDILSVSKDEPEIIDSLKSQNNSFSFLHKNNDSQLITSTLKSGHFSQVYQKENNSERNSRNVLQTNEKLEVKSTGASTVLEEKQYSLEHNDGLIAETVLKSSEKEEILTKLQPKANDADVNVEVSKSRNDADSINHEFDFLESDTAHLSSKIQTQDDSKNSATLPSGINKNFDQFSSSEAMLPSKPVVKPKAERPVFKSNGQQEISDNRSETSVSISGAHSPVVSLSDSDSIDEKGSFTASAAYQSLLGNTVIPSKINKEVLESDSEDEVEKTLAHSVKKSNIKPKSSVQPKKNKSVHQSVDLKLADNKPKAVSMNKPQSKLSKSTKKVLGIDTSSSSEVEAAVKPLENKKDEDSDEFDFYD